MTTLSLLQILAMAVSLVFPSHPAPKPPRGYLDCAFNAHNVYQCKP